ncbi:MAG: hypothetical protein HZB10_01975 [Candidatus Yonathbacteria bacterium]|nr:hypothetical protein [Candidatus Yonathbacteria bacterium]
MAYKILKPEVTDVWISVRSQAKTSWWFWGFVIASFSEAYFLGNYWLFLLIMFYIMSATNKARDSFWNQVAKKNGWQYKGTMYDVDEPGIMFKQGKGRDISPHRRECWGEAF